MNKILLKTKNSKFDFLSVDVEGHELQVLEGFDFNLYSPDVIVVEYLDLTVSKIEVKNQNIENIFKTDLYKFLISIILIF